MISTFVLTNAQPSYATKSSEVIDEEEKKASRVQSLLKPKLEFQKKSKKAVWIPSAPMKADLVQMWVRKINEKPWKYSQYMVEGNTLWKTE